MKENFLKYLTRPGTGIILSGGKLIDSMSGQEVDFEFDENKNYITTYSNLGVKFIFNFLHHNDLTGEFIERDTTTGKTTLHIIKQDYSLSEIEDFEKIRDYFKIKYNLKTVEETTKYDEHNLGVYSSMDITTVDDIQTLIDYVKYQNYIEISDFAVVEYSKFRTTKFEGKEINNDLILPSSTPMNVVCSLNHIKFDKSFERMARVSLMFSENPDYFCDVFGYFGKR